MSGVFLIYLAHSLQRLFERRRAVRYLSVWQYFSGLDSVAVTYLPGGDTHLLREQVDGRFQSKLALADTKAAKGSRRRVVGVVSESADVGVLVAVWAHGMGAGPFKHRAAERRVGPRVKVYLTVKPGKDTVLVAAERETPLHRVALGVEGDRFAAGKLYLHRPAHGERRQHGDVLRGDVLFAAEAAADKFILHHNTLRLPTEHDRDLFASIVDALVRGIDLYAVFVREGEGALGLEEGVFREGRAVAPGHDVFRFGQRFFGVAARNVS